MRSDWINSEARNLINNKTQSIGPFGFSLIGIIAFSIAFWREEYLTAFMIPIFLIIFWKLYFQRPKLIKIIKNTPILADYIEVIFLHKIQLIMKCTKEWIKNGEISKDRIGYFYRNHFYDEDDCAFLFEFADVPEISDIVLNRRKSNALKECGEVGLYFLIDRTLESYSFSKKEDNLEWLLNLRKNANLVDGTLVLSSNDIKGLASKTPFNSDEILEIFMDHDYLKSEGDEFKNKIKIFKKTNKVKLNGATLHVFNDFYVLASSGISDDGALLSRYEKFYYDRKSSGEYEISLSDYRWMDINYVKNSELLKNQSFSDLSEKIKKHHLEDQDIKGFLEVFHTENRERQA